MISNSSTSSVDADPARVVVTETDGSPAAPPTSSATTATAVTAAVEDTMVGLTLRRRTYVSKVGTPPLFAPSLNTKAGEAADAIDSMPSEGLMVIGFVVANRVSCVTRFQSAPSYFTLANSLTTLRSSES